jgi:hypothetical protein
MFAATAERPAVQGAAFKAASSRGTRPSVDGESFVLYLQPYVAFQRLSI